MASSCEGDGQQGYHGSCAWSYIVGMEDTCRPGSSHGNQMASTPVATRSTPTAWPNGLPRRQSFSAKMTAAADGHTPALPSPPLKRKPRLRTDTPGQQFQGDPITGQPGTH